MTQARASSSRMDATGMVKWAALGGGGLLALAGLRQGGPGGLLLAVGGGGLAYAGLSGRLAGMGRPGGGIDVEKSATINVPAEELYRFWRGLENLPRFMNHLESVTETDERRSRWVAKAPANLRVEWEAEVTEDIPGRRIAWRSLEGSQVPNEGSVEFRPAPGDRGTELRVKLQYRPPAGALGAAVARLFGEEPGQQVEDDLRRLKRLLEVGSEPTTEGQPDGRKGPIAKAAAGMYDNRRTG